MAGDVQLCPCCASHLRIPAELHVMRCNTCDAELVLIQRGGVSGLALLPGDENIVPYSHPMQRNHHFDGRELLDFRRALVLRAATRRQAVWAGLFFLTLGLLAGTIAVGLFGAGRFVQGSREQLEGAALALLCAMTGLPIFAYTALYFQGRARLVRESVRRWM
jgi:hypothetical protein